MKQKNQLRPKTQRLLAALVIGLLALLIGAAMLAISVPVLRFAQDPERFRLWVDSHGILGRLAYCALVILQVLVAVIPAEPLEILGGYAFGSLEGSLLCLLAEWLGGIFVFLLVRRWGRGLVELFFPPEKLSRLRFLQSTPRRKRLFLLIFMLPGSPKDLLCYYAGLTDLGLGPWLLISSLGRLPAILSSTFGGDALGSKEYLSAALVFLITFVISALGLWLYDYLCRRNQSRRQQKEEPSSDK